MAVEINRIDCPKCGHHLTWKKMSIEGDKVTGELVCKNCGYTEEKK